MDNDPMKPRPLTSEEIADILSVVPNVKGASVDVNKYNRASMLETLKEQLKEIQVTPLAISDIKSEIIRNFNESIIRPGSAVGINAAEALGQPITQMALNSFHQSGSSKNVTGGVDGIKELINASPNIKNPSCSIFFKNQGLSFEDVMVKMRPKLTEITVKDVVRGFPDIIPANTIEDTWWYQPYRLIIRDDFQSTHVLILDIDVNVLFAYKITMRDIARVIEQDQSVICVYSPMNVGKIHIYPVDRMISVKNLGSVSEEKKAMTFLYKTVIPALDKYKISGVEGIDQIYPVEAPVWQIVKDEQKASDGMWFLILNQVRMKITGISVQKLTRLCEACNIKVVKIRPNYIAVDTPGGESPTAIINRLIGEDKANEKLYEKTKRNEGALTIRRPPTAITNESQLVYADSDGSKFTNKYSTLKTLLSRPDIDSTRTFCNNVHEIKEVLGLEAARSFLIKSISDVIGFEGYINPRHIVLLVDYMTSLGEVNGITFSKVSRQDIGALEKASFQQAFETFKEASGFGESRELKGTTASIYVGKKAEIGTGYSDTYMDTSKFKELEEVISDPNFKLDIGEFKDGISNLQDIVFEPDMLIMEGAEEEMFASEIKSIPGSSDVVTVGDINAKIGKLPDLVKGPIVRSGALEIAARKLNEAPCLLQKKSTVRVEIPSELKLNTAPIPTKEIVGIPEVPAIPYVLPGELGLPGDLLEQMKRFIEPPKEVTMPLVGLPDVPESEIIPEIIPEQKPEGVVMFDLGGFIG